MTRSIKTSRTPATNLTFPLLMDSLLLRAVCPSSRDLRQMEMRISIWRKSLLDGHTALSSSESISKGNVKFVAGVLLVFIDRVIDASLASLGLAF